MEQKKQKRKVASIETEYVRILQKKEQRKNARKVRLYRRLTVFAIVAAILIGGMVQTFSKQKQALIMKEQQKVELISQLEEMKEEQEVLNKQLVKLDDDEYIAKLARKEYFLSENNEIIFSIPEKKKEKEKKDDGKE